MVFQSYALWPHLNVERNIAFGLEERRLPKPEIRRRVSEALESVHLAGLGERSIDQLSGGQQQRVALARALVVKPKCLLLDEPLSNLDAKLRVEMRHEIRRIVKENGLTAIYVTHDQEEALSMADRLAVMESGSIAQIGTPEEIYRRPRNAHVAGFMGETNFLAGKVVEVHGEEIVVETPSSRLRGRATVPGWSPATGEVVRLSIRPEAWRIGQATDNAITGRIVQRTYVGQRIQYSVETASGPQQVVELNPHLIHDVGKAPVTLHVRADDVVILPVEHSPVA
jgi:ABC-type Fe3+/spermidine/putrescine transport system ATPase subunit